MAVCAEEGDIAGAMACAQALLDPHTQQMPADLVSCLDVMIAAQQAGDTSEVLAALKGTMQIAQANSLL